MVLNTSNPDSPFATGLPALYGVAFLSGISLGLFHPFISILMAQHHVSDLIIGANSTLYFFVIAVGTPIVATILRQIGLRRTMMSGFALMAISASLFPLTDQLSLWFVIRIFMGLAVCLYFISRETAINAFCNDKNRAMVNGLDVLFFNLGFGLGPVFGSLIYDVSPKITFLLGGLLILSGILVVYWGLPERNIHFQTPKLSILKKLILPLQGAFAYGFSVATLVSLYPIYLLNQNYDVDKIGLTFGVFILGGLLATIPVTHLADLWGKPKVLTSSVVFVFVSLLSLFLIQNPLLISILTFIFGASISPLFPLSLALIASNVKTNELSSGSALFTATYSVGCTAGPIVSATMMTLFSPRHIFTAMIIIFGFFLINLSKNQQEKAET